jgi:cation:H+ antiporter
MLDLASFPIWANVLFFTGAAAAIWVAGVRLAGYAEEVAHRTGLGQAFVGALLLGGVTSLPEAATTVSAAAIGNAPLAVNNIFGGIALQVAVLALADWVARGQALSSRVSDDSVLLQAALLIGVLTVAAFGVLLPDVLIFGVGVWAAAVFGAALVAFFLIHQHATPGRWRPHLPQGPSEEIRADEGAAGHLSTSALSAALLVAAVVILGAGWVLAAAADALAETTGLGSSFMGAVVVAIATSLPEISTTLAAVKLGAYAMAYANIFGANILDAAIILLADAVYPGPAVLNEAGLPAAFAGLLGIALTAIFLVGLVSRRRRVVVGLGFDSVAVLVLYFGGVAMLYSIR